MKEHTNSKLNKKANGAFTESAAKSAFDADAKLLFHAIAVEDISCAEKVIKSGADVNAFDIYRGTPLHESASLNLQPVVEMLLDRGAAPDGRDKRGRTALHHAAANGDNETLQLLIERNADINAADEDGCTAVDYARAERNYGTMKILIDAGAKADDADKKLVQDVTQRALKRHIR